MRLKGNLLAWLVVCIGLLGKGISDASLIETKWVPLEDEYQTPALHTVYVDPNSMTRNGNVVVVQQLTDYRWMQGNAGFGRFGRGPHRFFSTVTRKEFHCADKQLRLLAFTEFPHHMGAGQPQDGYVDQSRWFPIEPASLNEGLWRIACK